MLLSSSPCLPLWYLLVFFYWCRVTIAMLSVAWKCLDHYLPSKENEKHQKQSPSLGLSSAINSRMLSNKVWDSLDKHVLRKNILIFQELFDCSQKNRSSWCKTPWVDDMDIFITVYYPIYCKTPQRFLIIQHGLEKEHPWRSFNQHLY